MTLRNRHWYVENSSRQYPIDERATGRDDADVWAPSNIIVDLQLRFPRSAGDFAFLGSITVTERLVAITIQAASSIDGTPTFVPLAVYTGQLPLETGIHYALEAQYPGAGGWIVFGDGLDQTYRGRFSTPRQSLLARRAARAYSSPPVTSLGKLHNAVELTGLVQLRALDPLELVKEERDIDGVLRDVAVLRLVQPTGAENVFSQFAGPCHGRPESDSCGDPAPIEQIGNVQPDCDGKITIQFGGCAEIAALADGCGVVVDCALALDEACTAEARLPDDDGNLPNQYTDHCNEPVAGDDEDDEDETPVEELTTCPSPYEETFLDGIAQELEVSRGEFVFVDESVAPDSSDSSEAPPAPEYVYATEGPNSAAIRNYSLRTCLNELSTLHIITRFKIMGGPSGAKHNAAIVLYSRAEFDEVLLLEFDYDLLSFRYGMNAPRGWVELSAVVAPIAALGEVIEMEATVTPYGPDNFKVTGTLTNMDRAQPVITLGPTPALLLPTPSEARVGLHANRSYTRFSYFKVF